MASHPRRPRGRNDFRVAVICALPLEADFVYNLFDKLWRRDGIDLGQAPGDQNAYTLGAIGKHNVVLVHMPGTGTVSAAAVSAGIRSSFTHIEVAFVVGICGAAPTHPETQELVNLGDCILSTVVIEYDFGKQYGNQFVRKSDVEEVHGRANPTIRALINQLKVSGIRKDLAEDLNRNLASLQAMTGQAAHPEIQIEQPGQTVGSRIAPSGAPSDTGSSQATTPHADVVQQVPSPQIHFGRIGSASTVVKSGSHREQLSTRDKIVGFEMEGAGTWDNLPTIVLKSVCDYADENKNDIWQPYAAATAAAGLQAILQYWSAADSTGIMSQVDINVPSRAVSHFVSRDDIQNELNQWLLNDAKQEKMVLLGMGGAGKSQLALACCRKAVESQHFTTVIWFDASTTLSVEQSLKIILSQIDEGQAVSLDAKENLSILTRALRSRQGAWLAVYDNYDTPEAFSQHPITEYIPRAEHGKVLFTSRHADSERLGRSIRVSRMSGEESLELLLKRPIFDTEEEEQTTGLQIAAELGYLALALDQAEAYIRARNLPLQEFLEHYKHRKKIILQEIPHQWEYGLSAFTTWELSFDQITGTEQMKKYKEHFLTLCAFFDLSSISKDYFESYCKQSSAEWTTILRSGPDWDGFLFDDLVAECRRLSLFQSETQDRSQHLSISLHPLIRDWLKLRKTDDQVADLAQEFTEMLSVHIDTDKLQVLDLFTRQQMLSNVVSCLEEDLRFRGSSPYYDSDLAYSAGQFGAVFYFSGSYDKAEELHVQVLIGRRERLGDRHPDTLRTMHNLAIIYNHKGRYDKAEELYNVTLACRQEQLGDGHPDTLLTMHNLAIIYESKARYDEAEELYNIVLASRQDRLGPEHPDTLTTMEGLAIVYESKGRYDEAEELFKLVLAGRQDRLGPKHPDTLGIMYNLAMLYQEKGRYDEAEELYNEVLAGRQDRLGPEHPDTLKTMHNLAVIYNFTGRYDEAEELFKIVLAG